VLELLHGVEGKVADEMGARAWMRGKWGEKGDGAVADDFSSGPVARGREGKRGGGPTGAAVWRRRRDEGGASTAVGSVEQPAMPPQPSGVGGGIAARTGKGVGRATRCGRLSRGPD
jgi:hypothetical protein